MADSPSLFQSPRRNTAVIVTFWLLGLAALLEIILASIMLTPRLVKALRNNPDTVNSTLVASGVATTQIPLAQPLEALPFKEIISQDNTSSNTLFQPKASKNLLQGGNTLGIVTAKLEGGDEGSRRLLIAMKSDPKASIDVSQVKVQVYFYDDDGSDTLPSKAQSLSKWLSSGTNWKNGEPELLEVRYLPDSSDPGIKFVGYIVAIYYKGDLQDYRAEPSRLTKLFPLKYFIGTEE
jgi:hypothetical protein